MPCDIFQGGELDFWGSFSIVEVYIESRRDSDIARKGVAVRNESYIYMILAIVFFCFSGVLWLTVYLGAALPFLGVGMAFVVLTLIGGHKQNTGD